MWKVAARKGLICDALNLIVAKISMCKHMCMCVCVCVCVCACDKQKTHRNSVIAVHNDKDFLLKMNKPLHNIPSYSSESIWRFLKSSLLSSVMSLSHRFLEKEKKRYGT